MVESPDALTLSPNALAPIYGRSAKDRGVSAIDDESDRKCGRSIGRET
jgi:hypothetical protein